MGTGEPPAPDAGAVLQISAKLTTDSVTTEPFLFTSGTYKKVVSSSHKLPLGYPEEPIGSLSIYR